MRDEAPRSTQDELRARVETHGTPRKQRMNDLRTKHAAMCRHNVDAVAQIKEKGAAAYAACAVTLRAHPSSTMHHDRTGPACQRLVRTEPKARYFVFQTAAPVAGNGRHQVYAEGTPDGSHARDAQGCADRAVGTRKNKRPRNPDLSSLVSWRHLQDMQHCAKRPYRLGRAGCIDARNN